jgi:hypothetical protein
MTYLFQHIYWEDVFYQVSVHLAERFQRRRLKCEKLTDDGRQVMVKAHSHHRQLLILIGRLNNIFSSQTAWPNKLKRGRKHLWKVFYAYCTFRPDPLIIMAATVNSCIAHLSFCFRKTLYRTFHRGFLAIKFWFIWTIKHFQRRRLFF